MDYGNIFLTRKEKAMEDSGKTISMESGSSRLIKKGMIQIQDKGSSWRISMETLILFLTKRELSKMDIILSILMGQKYSSTLINHKMRKMRSLNLKSNLRLIPSMLKLLLEKQLRKSEEERRQSLLRKRL